MAIQYLVPGIGYVNEVGTRQYLIPGSIYIAVAALIATTAAPTTLPLTTLAPTTVHVSTAAPTTLPPTTLAPTTLAPTTLAPTTLAPTTPAPTTSPPTTEAPTTAPPVNPYQKLLGQGVCNKDVVQTYHIPVGTIYYQYSDHSYAEIVISTPGRLRRLRVELSVAPGSGSYTITILKNGVATSLAVTISDPDTT